MRLADRMVSEGNWLFRNRSYLPLVLLALAIGGMYFNYNHYYHHYRWFELLCFLISLSGQAIRVISVGYAADRTSGRNTKAQVADELNTSGIYSLVRNPLYLGNFLMWLGIAILTEVDWLVAVFCLIYWLYYERIILAEESFLAEKFGAVFTDYTTRVACFFPVKGKYTPNKYNFRLKKVLRQENPSLFGLICVFIAIKVMKDYIYYRAIYLDKLWIIIGLVGLVLYLTLRALKKLTRVLHNDPMSEKKS